MTDDGKLSQDEIDALLNLTNDVEASNEESSTTEELATNAESNEENSEHRYLTPLEEDTLGEIGNISFGSSATTLSTLLNQKVEITTPTVSIVRKTGLKEEFPYEHVKLQVNFEDGFDGENIFLMKATDAAVISDIMLGGDGQSPKKELTEIELSAVQEAMNQMMGASATSMSTVFNKRVDISPPLVEYEDIDKLEEVFDIVDDEDVFVRVSFRLKVGDLIDSSIMQLMPLKFAKVLVHQLLEPEEEIAVTATEEVPAIEQNIEDSLLENINENVGVKEEMPAMMHEQVQQQAPQRDSEPQKIGENVHEKSAVQSASFSQFEPVDLSSQEQRNLDMLLDIPLSVTVELGRTKQNVADILDLTAGSIIELDKLAGEPVDVLVNNKLIAKGEVVVIDENFGVRITDVISTKDRLMKLN